jgi:hypothetical protein
MTGASAFWDDWEHVRERGVGGVGRELSRNRPRLRLVGLSTFEQHFYGSGHGGREGRSTIFAREDVVATGTPTAKSGTRTSAAGETHMYGRKTTAILQSAVIHGSANNEEVELVTGMRVDVRCMNKGFALLLIRFTHYSWWWCYVSVCLYVCMSVCLYVRMSVCLYVCMSVHM